MITCVDIDWSELKARFLQARKDKGWSSQPILNSVCKDNWCGTENQQWAGGTGDDTERWLLKGFFAEAFTANDLEIKPRPRKRASWSEDDGEVDIGRLYGGSDTYLLTSALRDSIPGITLEIEYDFGAAGLGESIAKYGAWLCGLIRALEAHGYDLEIVICVRSMQLFQKQRYDERTDVRIIVKRGGQISDFTSWSAMFAPTGFRHLVFCAFGIAGDALSKKCAQALGGPITTGWGIKKHGSLISVTCDSRGEEKFPLAQLNRKAKEEGIIA